MQRPATINGPVRYKPVGLCVYCGARGGLSDEHVVPFALNGDLVLPKASCSTCAALTMRFEQEFCRTMFGPLRIALNLRTRRKRERPTTLRLKRINREGETLYEEMNANEYPAYCLGFKFPPPGALLGNAPETGYKNPETVLRLSDAAKKVMLEPGHSVELVNVNMGAFLRTIAKAAHCYAVAVAGPSSFDPWLPAYIVGPAQTFPYVLGGGQPPSAEVHGLHVLSHAVKAESLHTVTVTLFHALGMPSYEVVVGSGKP